MFTGLAFCIAHDTSSVHVTSANGVWGFVEELRLSESQVGHAGCC